MQLYLEFIKSMKKNKSLGNGHLTGLNDNISSSNQRKTRQAKP